MDDRHRIEDTSSIISPGLVVFADIVRDNVRAMIAIAGSAARLRPHCKTHKMREIIALELEMGITRHKCATFAEAEMLAEAGVEDIFLAYNLVGPNVTRAVRFLEAYPNARLLVTADHAGPITALGAAMSQAGRSIGVLLDVDTGLRRTGVEPGPAALDLYRRIVETPGLEPAGLHLYDGQNHQTPLDERTRAVEACWRMTARLRDQLVGRGWPVPRIVAGGTGSFPIYAAMDDPALELSPGTCVLHDAGYEAIYPDMHFTPAAMVLTRVISRPAPGRVTFDLGSKACASDPPAGHRLAFPDIPDAREVLHNEEHLVLETSRADALQPGDEALAIPVHICPTSALHRQAFVVEGGRLTGRWDVVARDRWLTI
jgi:D-serine deaminase-like pyridoxal phosphate-dependent protein